jgi:hypothetical protein
MRMMPLPVSATIMLPLASTATPEGLLKEAAVPVVPSAYAAAPFPAIVDTNPLGAIRRIRWFAESATITFPLAASTATP